MQRNIWGYLICALSLLVTPAIYPSQLSKYYAQASPSITGYKKRDLDYFSRLPSELFCKIIDYTKGTQDPVSLYTYKEQWERYFRVIDQLKSVSKHFYRIYKKHIDRDLNPVIFKVIDSCLTVLPSGSRFERWKECAHLIFTYKRYIYEKCDTNSKNRLILPSLLSVLLDKTFDKEGYYKLSHVYLDLVTLFIEQGCFILQPSCVKEDENNTPLWMSCLHIVNTQEYGAIAKDHQKFSKIARMVKKRAQLLFDHFKRNKIEVDLETGNYNPEDEKAALKATAKTWLNDTLPTILN